MPSTFHHRAEKHTWRYLSRADIDAFKKSWPCHGLPDELDSLSFWYAPNGDLVDIIAQDAAMNSLDTHDFDGTSLAALSCKE